MGTARHLYVYYRLPEACLSELRPTLAATLAACQAGLPGLRASLQRRPGAQGGEVTVMETYAREAGIDAAAQQHIESTWSTLFRSRGLQVQRHIELFEPL
jgi:hypothetical protein